MREEKSNPPGEEHPILPGTGEEHPAGMRTEEQCEKRVEPGCESRLPEVAQRHSSFPAVAQRVAIRAKRRDGKAAFRHQPIELATKQLPAEAQRVAGRRGPDLMTSYDVGVAKADHATSD